MTKHDWKVGDRARVAAYGGFSTANDHLGKEGTITFIYPAGNCDLKTERGLRCGLLKDLEPLPTETPKDPFAPGEYVTCVEGRDIHGTREGDVLRVDGYPHWEKNCFCAMGEAGIQGYEKSKFRPATPEEIAAHLEKTATKGCAPKVESATPLDTDAQSDGKITFIVAGREFFVGQRVWTTLGVLDRCYAGDCLIVCGEFDGLNSLSVRKPDCHFIFGIDPNMASDVAHEWKFGDQATHPDHGAVLIIDMTESEAFQCASPSDPEIFIDPAELTFIRRTDLGD